MAANTNPLQTPKKKKTQKVMSEDEVRDAMKAYKDIEDRPADEKIEELSQASGLSIERVREIYGEETGNHDAWGPDEFFVDDHRS